MNKKLNRGLAIILPNKKINIFVMFIIIYIDCDFVNVRNRYEFCDVARIPFACSRSSLGASDRTQRTLLILSCIP